MVYSSFGSRSEAGSQVSRSPKAFHENSQAMAGLALNAPTVGARFIPLEKLTLMLLFRPMLDAPLLGVVPVTMGTSPAGWGVALTAAVRVERAPEAVLASMAKKYSVPLSRPDIRCVVLSAGTSATLSSSVALVPW